MTSPSAWLDFLTAHYLDGYIAQGGSKVKFLIGPGSGKTEMLQELVRRARQKGYEAVYIDLRNARLQQFQTLYGLTAAEVHLDEIVGDLGADLIRRLGYDPADVPDSNSFYGWAVGDRRRLPEVLRREVMEAVEGLWREVSLAGPFRVAVTGLMLRRLGVLPASADEDRVLCSWLHAEPLRIAETRRFQIYERIDRYNARLMLKSLLHLITSTGRKGLVVGLDNLDVLLERHPETGRRRYTRAGRDDAYESIRQLIDEIDALPNTWFFFAGGQALMDDDNSGLRSYEALWLRIQEEVRSARFNQFLDLVETRHLEG
ncbi:MAG: DUF2791 family P-loop domain-containing protein [Chloroflexi bacterium]|nr:DUF2791 family P-loop domain-containing protein [Chloroflexota bacterium]